MSRIYVVGGRQKPGVTAKTDEWHHYSAGIIVAVDPDGSIHTRVEHVTPPDACASAQNPSILFKSATLVGNCLYVPTQTELLIYAVPSFQQVAYLSLPCFNDVHHVSPGPDGTLLVANTGLDMVVEVTRDGLVRREWSVIGEALWTRFSRDVDYRKVITTKPHRSHPNHVFMLGQDIWATRCNQYDAVCLTREQPAMHLGEHPVHDGLVRNGRIHFTTVNGQVVIVDAGSLRVICRYDLNAIYDSTRSLGWARGLELLDEDHIVVGFSRLRPTKWEQNIRWVKNHLGGEASDVFSTRIAMFNVRRGGLCWEVDLEPAGMNAVFSIHRAPASTEYVVSGFSRT
jgi:hypothetical protein